MVTKYSVRVFELPGNASATERPRPLARLEVEASGVDQARVKLEELLAKQLRMVRSISFGPGEGAERDRMWIYAYVGPVGSVVAPTVVIPA